MDHPLIAQWINAAHAANQRGDHAVAADLSQRATRLVPDVPEAWYHLGIACGALGRRADALAALHQCSLRTRSAPQAQNDIGLRYLDLDALEAAERCLTRALTLAPDYALAHSNLGKLRARQNRQDTAELHFRQAIALCDNIAAVHLNLGSTLAAQGRHAEALACFERAHVLDPDLPYLAGTLLHARAMLCDWSTDTESCERVAEKAENGEASIRPFELLPLCDTPSRVRVATEHFARREHPGQPGLGPLPPRRQTARIRIGYFSSDFRNHAVSALMVECLERHDRTRFELYAFSSGPQSDDPLALRVRAAFEHFLEVGGQSDHEVAQLARRLDIDIAVDLGGYTEGARPGVFALRAAPVQASYLGYLGTLGAPWMDYLIADRIVVPETSRHHYTECIAYLPSYQANDTTRALTAHTPTRDALGLPDSGFVFCCFNNPYKINAEVFDSWTRILLRVPGSVLFLLANDPVTVGNLCKEAARRGLAPERLVFGTRLDTPQYLARYRATDLFLDTLPYNAGTTASDALWAGLPVLTRIGNTFSGRIAASLLTAAGLPELVAPSAQAYEDLAVALSREPARLAELRARLDAARSASRLFDMQGLMRSLERSFEAMHARCLAGLAPADLAAFD